VNVPSWRLELVSDEPVLVSSRFDRAGSTRIPFLSALSMLGARDDETRSYLEIVDALRQQGARPLSDMHELWSRIVLAVLISNVDDHMRNHAFLYVGSDGWALSPAYDLNPVPTDVRPRFSRVRSISKIGARRSSSRSRSLPISSSIKTTQAGTRKRSPLPCPAGDRKRPAEVWLEPNATMASSFDHDDLAAALRL
jgi:serine/threonine-protein kinase HipA